MCCISSVDSADVYNGALHFYINSVASVDFYNDLVTFYVKNIESGVLYTYSHRFQ